MKHYYFLAALSVLALASCNKEELSVVDNDSEIVLNVKGDALDMTVETKATAITSVPSSLYWSATTGTSTETSKYASASATVASGKIKTGKYQTAQPTAYNYYVANKAITFAAGGSTIVASNDTDVVAGRASATTSTSPSVALDHIFARTGSLTANAPSGYTISDVSWTIVQSSTSATCGTAGTYNIKTGAWTAVSTRLSSAAALTSTSDMYLIPGTYTFSITYTLTKGDWQDTFTKTANGVLVGGKVNNIKVSSDQGDGIVPPPTNGPSEIEITVTLNPWGNNDVTLNL